MFVCVCMCVRSRVRVCNVCNVMKHGVSSHAHGVVFVVPYRDAPIWHEGMVYVCNVYNVCHVMECY